MRRYALELKPYRRKTAWKKAYGDQDGERFNAEAEARFDRTDNAYRTLLGHIGQSLITTTSVALDGMIERYTAQKRAAAVLDFDDLLHHARALVAGREEVRQALGLHAGAGFSDCAVPSFGRREFLVPHRQSRP